MPRKARKGFALPLVKVVLLVIAVLVGIVVLKTWFVNRSSDEALKLTSDDGKVLLTVPIDGLPKGTSGKDIAVKQITNQDNDDILVYELTPDGLTLSQPATIVLNLETDGAIPMISHFSGEELLPVENVEVVVGTDGKTKISAQISHFSFLYVNFDFVKIGIRGPFFPVTVGDSFSVFAKIVNTGKIDSFILDSGTRTTRSVKNLLVTGKFIVDQSREIVGPAIIEGRPDQTKIEKSDFVSVEGTFYCREAGIVLISLEARLIGDTEIVFRPAAQETFEDFTDIRPFDEKFYVITAVDCANKEDTGITVNAAPRIEMVDYTQLHGSYEELPHRYLLKAIARDPEGGNLTFSWKINCGYFVGPTNKEQVEWHYNTPGECVDAVATVSVRDNVDNVAEKIHAIFYNR